MQIDKIINQSISEGLKRDTLIKTSPRGKIKELKQKVLPLIEQEKTLVDKRY